MCGTGYLSKVVRAFNLFPQGRHAPFSLGTMWSGDDQDFLEGRLFSLVIGGRTPFSRTAIYPVQAGMLQVE